MINISALFEKTMITFTENLWMRELLLSVNVQVTPIKYSIVKAKERLSTLMYVRCTHISVNEVNFQLIIPRYSLQFLETYWRSLRKLALFDLLTKTSTFQKTETKTSNTHDFAANTSKIRDFVTKTSTIREYATKTNTICKLVAKTSTIREFSTKNNAIRKLAAKTSTFRVTALFFYCDSIIIFLLTYVLKSS